MQSILILLAVLTGWTLRGYRIESIRQAKKKIEKKIYNISRNNKSGGVCYIPPVSEEEEASKEVIEKIKQ